MPEPQVGHSAGASQTMDPEEGMVVMVVEEGAIEHPHYSEAVMASPGSVLPHSKAEVCQLVVEEEEEEGALKAVQGYLEGCRFMDVQLLVQLLMESRWALECVPPGLKEYVYFVVNNENNIRRRSKKKRSDFPDDCGAWLSGSGSTPRTTFMLMPDGDLKQVFLRKGRYYTERTVRRCKEYVPVLPQPSPDTLLELHRYYVSLKMDTSYRKRVSWLGPGGKSGYGHVAVVEYIGKFPGFSPQGKASGVTKYVRPAPCMQEGLSPGTVHYQMLQQYQRLHGLRDVQQVRDSRHRFLQQQQKATAPSPLYPALFEDSLARLQEMVQEGDHLVRAAWHLPGRRASVALCSEDQLKSIRSLCLSGHTLLGVDRHLTICGLTVTPTGYRHLALVRPGDGCPPVFLGPVLVHQGPDLGEYAAFLSHLKVLLGQADTSQLVVGTEDVPILVRAVQLSLPGASHTVLSAHLVHAAADWLRNDGLWEEDFGHAMEQVVGPVGLLTTPHLEALQHCGEQLLQRWGGVAPGFSAYLSTQLLPLLQSKMQDSPRVCQMDRVWTSAPQDSVTHLLEEAVDWASHSLLDFVEVVRQQVERQAGDLVKALVGEGPYILAPQAERFGMNREAWECLTQQQQLEVQERLMEHLCEVEWSQTLTPVLYKTEPLSPTPVQDDDVPSVEVEHAMCHTTITSEDEVPHPTSTCIQHTNITSPGKRKRKKPV